MLIGFTVENFRSFLNETRLSMVATSDKEHREFNVISAEHDDLLKSVLIYGPNAGGKSNLIHAMHYMQQMVSSSIDVQTEHIKRCQPFTFREDAKSLPVKFEISFVSENMVYEYGFDILNGQINKEYLYKKAKRRTLVFERSAPEYESIQLTSDMADVEALKKNVRNDVLFLTWAAYANNKTAIQIVEWISKKLLIVGFGNQDFKINILDNNLVNEYFLNFPKKADNDIVNIKLKSGELLSSHWLYNENWDKMKTIDVSFDMYSSDGTKRMLELSDSFFRALTKTAVIIIDEMDLHLHPVLVRHLIALINSIAHNPDNAQLVCTTHDVMLLDEDIRRDQIWFVEKDEHSVSNLYSLSDFKDIRKNSDILKRYLLGVYGAVPDLNRGDANEQK